MDYDMGEPAAPTTTRPMQVAPRCSLLLPIELTNGNKGRGHKWFKSSKVRKEYEAFFRASGIVRDQPFDTPVRVVVTRILGKGQSKWDSSSIGRGNWKELEDALVTCGWFHDDGPRWIVKTEFEQDATRRSEGPATQVDIYAA